MEMSSYNACLLISKAGGKNFGIAGLQTNDTLNIGIKTFMNKEEAKITEAKFKAKSQTILGTGATGDFNDYHITMKLNLSWLCRKIKQKG